MEKYLSVIFNSLRTSANSHFVDSILFNISQRFTKKNLFVDLVEDFAEIEKAATNRSS